MIRALSFPFISIGRLGGGGLLWPGLLYCMPKCPTNKIESAK